jgi:uncharacterized integral membrane protein (TIGR00697 family)
MNEALFFIHILFVMLLTFAALRIGKEALVALSALQAVISNLFVLKQMVLFSWNVTCSDVYAVGTILSLNLVQEYFGKDAAKRSIWISFFGMFFFGLMSQLHLLYAPSPYDAGQSHFQFLLNPAPRLLLASWIAFFTVQHTDLYFFGFLKKTLNGLSWKWRNLLSLLLSQLLDTFLFTFLGLWGTVASLGSIIAFSLTLKLLIIFSITSLTALAKRFSPHEV